MLGQSQEDDGKANCKAMDLRVAAASSLMCELENPGSDANTEELINMLQDEGPVDVSLILHTCRVLNINCLVLSAAHPKACKALAFRARQRDTWVAVAVLGTMRDNSLRFVPVHRQLPHNSSGNAGAAAVNLTSASQQQVVHLYISRRWLPPRLALASMAIHWISDSFCSLGTE